MNRMMDSWNHIPYTWKHWNAFLMVEKELTGHHKYILHDWDKLVMYALVPWLGTKRIHHLHERISRHHLAPYKNLSGMNFEEAIIDWECARYTKPDKPMNARETMNRFYSQYTNELEPILKRWGL